MEFTGHAFQVLRTDQAVLRRNEGIEEKLAFVGPLFSRCRQAQGRRVEDGFIAVPAQGIDGFDRSDVAAVLAEDRRIAQAQEGTALAADNLGRHVADGHDGVDFFLGRFIVLVQFLLHDVPQVVEEGCRVGQSRDHPGLGRRLFQRDRAGDGGAQAVIVQVELDCLALAPVGTVEMPAGQGDGEAGALQGALQVITCLFVFVVVRIARQSPIQVQVGCGDERRPQRRADEVQ